MRDLILVLADSKRLLGTRYAEWILGAPELEAGIACASMAQDEWGHGRLLYALLKDFGDDVDKLEHERDAGDYRSMEVLDRAPQSWPELIALNALADTALTIQLEALSNAEHAPLRQRVQKLLDEEFFHGEHARAWLKRLASASDESRREMKDATQRALPMVLRWFGNGPAGDQLRKNYLARISALLDNLEVTPAQPSFDNFDEKTRRTHGTAPDADTIRRVRGDKNRAFLMD